MFRTMFRTMFWLVMSLQTSSNVNPHPEPPPDAEEVEEAFEIFWEHCARASSDSDSEGDELYAAAFALVAEEVEQDQARLQGGGGGGGGGGGRGGRGGGGDGGQFFRNARSNVRTLVTAAASIILARNSQTLAAAALVNGVSSALVYGAIVEREREYERERQRQAGKQGAHQNGLTMLNSR